MVPPAPSPPLRLILDRRLNVDGKEFPPLAYVFGDATGERIKDIKTQWTTMRLRATGFTGQIRNPQKRRLTPEAQRALKAYGLRFHDLRREAGSSFADDGMDPRAIQTFLDHASLSTTTRYLRLSQKALQRETRRIDEKQAKRA